MLNFLKLLFSAVGEFFGFLKQNQLIEAGETKVVAAQQKEEIKIVKQATEARTEAATAAASIPITDSLPDDGFRRD